MPKKKPAQNAFYFFMVDYRQRCERNGERFKGFNEVSQVAGPEWDVMSAEKKKKYEIMAKEAKAKLKGDTSKKETCLHKNFDSIDREMREREDAKMEMNNFIETTIMSLSTKKLLAEYKFYLVHVNHFCVSEGECYHPAELALCEFSLAEGVNNVYHTIIDPGPIPLGYRHDAMTKSESTHKIPFEKNGGEKDLYKILTDIQKFIQPGTRTLGGEYPPLFTMPENVNLNTSIKSVRSVIETLCGADPYEGEVIEKYRIYPIEKLFLELQKACSKQSEYEDEGILPNIGLALLELEKDIFNYTPHIACEFHRKEDVVQFCSKSYVQRWVFLICDYCCQYLDIAIIPGRHLPENADIDFSRKQQIREQEEKPVKPREFTWQDSSAPPKASFVAVEQPPLRAPTVQANLAAMMPKRQELDKDSFPSLNDEAFSIGRGKFRGGRGGRGGGGGMSFASAMKKN